MNKNLFHIDMNSFYASCEQIRAPHLRNKPIVVGGDPKKRKGIVLASSYEAKRQGVFTTMPIWQAIKKCPEVIIIPADHEYYKKISTQVMKLLDQYTPLKEQMSIDEACLDMTGSEGIFGEPKEAALMMQRHIQEELGLPSSIGISSNKILAKMASDMKKPMGITVLYHKDIAEKLWPLPVEKLYGVGPKQRERLISSQIFTIGQLAQYPIERLIQLLGNQIGSTLHQYANGIDHRPVISTDAQEVKSISNEKTFAIDLVDKEDMKREILALAEKVGWRVRQTKVQGKTIFIKMKYYNFQTITRNYTLVESTNVTEIIYKNALKLFQDNWNHQPIRLLGVGLTNLSTDSYEQISLWSTQKETVIKSKKVDQMVDSLREKYGYDILQRASTIENDR